MHAIPEDISKAARDTALKTRVPASVTIAQWALESGWGGHSPGNNPFGMKPRKGRDDPSQLLTTTEFINGKAVRLPQPFRKFDSIGDAFEAHAELISKAPVYADAMAVLPKDGCPTAATIDKFITKMSIHYASDPLYASKLRAIISANSLGTYDV